MTIELTLLILLLVANGSPVVARAICGRRCNAPLDRGRSLGDGRRLLGASKTYLGVSVAVLSSSALAPVLGLDWYVGTLIGIGSMLGDALSSFIKRRRNLPPGARATGLDQIPESLLPMLACKPLLGLAWWQVALLTLLFMLANLGISRLTASIGLRHHPH